MEQDGRREAQGAGSVGYQGMGAWMVAHQAAVVRSGRTSRKTKAHRRAGSIGYYEQHDGIRSRLRQSPMKPRPGCSRIIRTSRYFPATRSKSWNALPIPGQPQADDGFQYRAADGARGLSERIPYSAHACLCVLRPRTTDSAASPTVHASSCSQHELIFGMTRSKPQVCLNTLEIALQEAVMRWATLPRKLHYQGSGAMYGSHRHEFTPTETHVLIGLVPGGSRGILAFLAWGFLLNGLAAKFEFVVRLLCCQHSAHEAGAHRWRRCTSLVLLSSRQEGSLAARAAGASDARSHFDIDSS